MNTFLQALCVAFLVPSILACVYYVVLAVVALAPRRAETLAEGGDPLRFAIVIPAHDEEKSIIATVEACRGLDYPKDRHTVYVVADNCSDRTAELAGAAGATALVRYDERRRGKGHALTWAFDRVLARGHDAVVVLDADCRLDDQALRAFDRRLRSGERALQANDVASNPSDSATSYAVAVGNLIENDLFYAPKDRLRLAVFLRGTGMVFHREVLEEVPWDADSLTEDTEYTLRLLRKGIRVGFVPEIRARSEFPVSGDQLKVQRRRWSGGGLYFVRTQALRLIGEGLVTSRGLLIDAGWTLLILSRPLVLLELGVAAALGALCAWREPGPLSSTLLAACCAVVLLDGVYFSLGVLKMGINARRLRFLLGAPAVVARLAVISLAGIVLTNRGPWVRTPR
jgi:cellulose synthase/poly-beta-1,6-N-acetylglucosamine synthase-like glycosyltransferase